MIFGTLSLPIAAMNDGSTAVLLIDSKAIIVH